MLDFTYGFGATLGMERGIDFGIVFQGKLKE